MHAHQEWQLGARLSPESRHSASQNSAFRWGSRCQLIVSGLDDVAAAMRSSSLAIGWYERSGLEAIALSLRGRFDTGARARRDLTARSYESTQPPSECLQPITVRNTTYYE